MAQNTTVTGKPPGAYPERTTLKRNAARDLREHAIRNLFFAAAAVSVLTTVGIILARASEALAFFQEVSLFDFLGDTEWTPLFANQKFGIWALVSATILTSFIALIFAVP